MVLKIDEKNGNCSVNYSNNNKVKKMNVGNDVFLCTPVPEITQNALRP